MNIAVGKNIDMSRGKVAVIKQIEIITRLAIKHVNDYYVFYY